MFGAGESSLIDCIKPTTPISNQLFFLHVVLLVSPLRLQLGIEKLPREYTPVKRAIEVAYARYTHVQAITISRSIDDKTLNESYPHKLQILLMGGSITSGVRYRQLLDNPMLRFFSNFDTQLDCAWPNCLNHFIDNIIGEDVAEMINVAIRATGSTIGKTLIYYQACHARIFLSVPM